MMNAHTPAPRRLHCLHPAHDATRRRVSYDIVGPRGKIAQCCLIDWLDGRAVPYSNGMTLVTFYTPPDVDTPLCLESSLPEE